MARFYGRVGYAPAGVLVDDVWTVTITERPYYGEVKEQARTLEPSDKVNDDIRSQNRIEIVADAYAFANFATIKYVLWDGVRWAVPSVAVQRPRLILSLGGVYDGPIPTS